MMVDTSERKKHAKQQQQEGREHMRREIGASRPLRADDGSAMPFNYCPTCSHDLDAGWECAVCGRDWSWWERRAPRG